MKLGEVNPDSTQARFFKGEMAYGLSDAFASVTCCGADEYSFNFEIEKNRQAISPSRNPRASSE
jgi:hypothetical protein